MAGPTPRVDPAEVEWLGQQPGPEVTGVVAVSGRSEELPETQ